MVRRFDRALSLIAQFLYFGLHAVFCWYRACLDWACWFRKTISGPADDRRWTSTRPNAASPWLKLAPFGLPARMLGAIGVPVLKPALVPAVSPRASAGSPFLLGDPPPRGSVSSAIHNPPA